MTDYREPKEENDLFFTCSLIEYISRETNHTKRYIVNTMGLEPVEKLYNLADVYHCENLDKTTEEFVTAANIENGNYDYRANCQFKIPDEYEIGRVYQKLILDVSQKRNQDFISLIFEVFNSWITEKIDDYNSSFYYSSPEYILACYLNGEMLEY